MSQKKETPIHFRDPMRLRRVVSDETRAYMDMRDLLDRDPFPNTPEDNAEFERIDRRARILLLRDLDARKVEI